MKVIEENDRLKLFFIITPSKCWRGLWVLLIMDCLSKHTSFLLGVICEYIMKLGNKWNWKEKVTLFYLEETGQLSVCSCAKERLEVISQSVLFCLRIITFIHYKICILMILNTQPILCSSADWENYYSGVWTRVSATWRTLLWYDNRAAPSGSAVYTGHKKQSCCSWHSSDGQSCKYPED